MTALQHSDAKPPERILSNYRKDPLHFQSFQSVRLKLLSRLGKCCFSALGFYLNDGKFCLWPCLCSASSLGKDLSVHCPLCLYAVVSTRKLRHGNRKGAVVCCGLNCQGPRTVYPGGASRKADGSLLCG